MLSYKLLWSLFWCVWFICWGGRRSLSCSVSHVLVFPQPDCKHQSTETASSISFTFPKLKWQHKTGCSGNIYSKMDCFPYYKPSPLTKHGPLQKWVLRNYVTMRHLLSRDRFQSTKRLNQLFPLTRIQCPLLGFNFKMLIFLLTGFFGVWPNFIQSWIHQLMDTVEWRTLEDITFLYAASVTVVLLQPYWASVLITKRLDRCFADSIMKYLGGLPRSLYVNMHY